MLPVSFIVVGAAKCGTSSMCDLLSGHPDVFLTRPKEPHYFSRLVNFERKRDWYRSLFDGAEGFKARGEGSTSYTHPNRIDFVVPRIRQALPECRLIYMVRHPIRRLESDWTMRLYEGRPLPESINEAVEEEASLLTFGLYWKHLSAYRRHFPDEQILVVFLEDFAANPDGEFRRVCGHIGVGTGFAPDDSSTPRNASADFRRHGAVGSVIHRLPGVERLKQAVPGFVLDTARRLFSNEFRPNLEWDPQIHEAVRRHYADDSTRLLEYCGKPPDFWGLTAC